MSGRTLKERALAAGHRVVEKRIVPDQVTQICAQLRRWIDDPNVDVVITTGGTGVTGRDVTPEAFALVCDKEIPGFTPKKVQHQSCLLLASVNEILEEPAVSLFSTAMPIAGVDRVLPVAIQKLGE